MLMGQTVASLAISCRVGNRENCELPAGDAPKTSFSNSGKCAWISPAFGEFRLFSACVGGDGATLATKWRWMLSRANCSLTNSRYQGKIQGIFVISALDALARNLSIAQCSGHLS